MSQNHSRQLESTPGAPGSSSVRVFYVKKVFHYRTYAEPPKTQFSLVKRKHLRLKVCIFDHCFCGSPLPELKLPEILGQPPLAGRSHRLAAADRGRPGLPPRHKATTSQFDYVLSHSAGLDRGDHPTQRGLSPADQLTSCIQVHAQVQVAGGKLKSGSMCQGGSGREGGRVGGP